MPAYIIVDIEITDPETYEEYKKLAPSSISNYEGKYLVRGAKVEVLEGSWTPGRFVILEFENAMRAKEWWSSEEYATAKKMRQSSSRTNMILVE